MNEQSVLFQSDVREMNGRPLLVGTEAEQRDGMAIVPIPSYINDPPPFLSVALSSSF